MNSFYQGKTFIVTGASGFIGSHLTDKLLSLGASVIGIDNFISGNERNIAHLASTKEFHFIEADVSTDPNTYLRLDGQPLATLDGIFHFASPASPVGYQKHPVETYMVNSMGTHNLLSYIKDSFPKVRFLFASTSEVYGDPLEHPQKETYFGNVNPNGERSMYDEGKRLGETICGVHHNYFGINTRMVRIFNTYGPRMDLYDGRVIPDFIRSVLENTPITIFGDGNQTRSFCYVLDLVEGIIRLMESDKASGETVNIGNPEEVTMLQLAREIEKVSEQELSFDHKAARPDDPKQRCPDIHKANELLSWQPTITLEQGLRHTYTYFKGL